METILTLLTAQENIGTETVFIPSQRIHLSEENGPTSFVVRDDLLDLHSCLLNANTTVGPVGWVFKLEYG